MVLLVHLTHYVALIQFKQLLLQWLQILEKLEVSEINVPEGHYRRQLWLWSTKRWPWHDVQPNKLQLAQGCLHRIHVEFTPIVPVGHWVRQLWFDSYK